MTSVITVHRLEGLTDTGRVDHAKLTISFE